MNFWNLFRANVFPLDVSMIEFSPVKFKRDCIVYRFKSVIAVTVFVLHTVPVNEAKLYSGAELTSVSGDGLYSLAICAYGLEDSRHPARRNTLIANMKNTRIDLFMLNAKAQPRRDSGVG